jgi:tRNA pseudouridine32 synthase / 23S rRNA pseudouridine746 synthase
MRRWRATASPPPPRPAEAPDLAARILLRTDAVLIIDKPAGLPIHAARAGVASLTDALPALRFGKRRDPQPAHRLDADTSGCLVLGRTAPALAELGRLFAERRVGKTYWAVVRGAPLGESGTISLPLRKTSTARTGWRMEAHTQGDPALTRWRALGRGEGLCWLELSPETGRTHQLRVHCAASGWPMLGDALYGAGGAPLHLLARAIALPLEPPIAATAPMPDTLAPAFRACGWVSD